MKVVVEKSVGVSACLVLLLSMGCASVSDASITPAAGVAMSAETIDEVYRIGVPDLLEVKVWLQEELSGEALVRTDGKISIPLIGDIHAEGKSPEELAEDIESKLDKFVAKPQVDISVLEMRSQVVSVIGGGIERSGVVELRHRMRILDAIAEMGGLTPFARKGRIRVLRNLPDGGGEIELPFDYAKFVNGRGAGTNFLLKPGDTIIVPE